MYKIYKVRYFTTLPINNIINIFKYLNFEGEPECQFNTLNEAINILKANYTKIVTKECCGKGTRYILYGIVDSFGNVKAVLNSDNNICVVQEGEQNVSVGDN